MAASNITEGNNAAIAFRRAANHPIHAATSQMIRVHVILRISGSLTVTFLLKPINHVCRRTANTIED